MSTVVLAFIQQGQNELANSDCSKAIELDNKDWNEFYCLGMAFAGQEKYDLAITNFNGAIEIAQTYNYCIACVV